MAYLREKLFQKSIPLLSVLCKQDTVEFGLGISLCVNNDQHHIK